MSQTLVSESGNSSNNVITPTLINTTSKFKGSVAFLREGTGTPKYTGQFGFDWMDLTNQQYHKCAGRIKYNKVLGQLEFDATTTASEFSKLEKEYDTFNIKGYDNGLGSETYYTPWFSSFKNSKHKLYLLINIVKFAKGSIELECNDKNIILNKTKIILNSGTDNSAIDEIIEISFKNAISQNAKIEAKFYDKSKKSAKGILIGALNIYKNDIEYDMNLKFVKVAVKGAIKVQGEKEKIVLDPIKKQYKYYNKKIKDLSLEIKTEIPNEIKKLNKTLKEVITDPPSNFNIFATSESDIKEDLTELKNKLKNKNKELVEVNRQYTVAKNIDLAQELNLNSSANKVKNKKQLLENIFGQALVNYNNSGTDDLVIEASDYKEIFDFTDEIEIYTHNNDYKIRYTEGKTYDTGEFKETTMNAYNNYKENENYIFMISLNMHNNNKHSHSLLGSAEDVSHEGYRAIMLPMADAETIVHEIGHVFNLYHTFNNKHINFCRGTIENIMDYTYFEKLDPGISANPIKKKTTFFKWQWDIIKNDPDLKKKHV